MIYGTAINNVHRNTRYLNKLVTQLETGVKFQLPSDDPISASRALRYRTILSETSQFLRNVESGLTWMEVSEAAFMNVAQNLLQSINVLTVAGANGTMTLEDRLAKIEEMRQHIDQIGLEMNQTFMGRYVFSGYKTNQPPVFMADNNDAFVITQQFNIRDMERIKSFQKETAISVPVSHSTNVLKLAYNNVDFDFNITDANGNMVAMPGIISPPGIGGAPPLQYTVITRSLSDMDAYKPPGLPLEDGTADNPFVVHFIKETGELVFSDAARDTFRDGTTVTYFRDGFQKGELNPLVYFDTVEVLGRVTQDATLSLRNPPVLDLDNGRFNFVAEVEGGTHPGEFDITQGSVGPVIVINGEEFNLWDMGSASTESSGNMWETTFAINQPGIDVRVVQHVTMGADTFNIEYSVVSNSTTTTPIDISFFKNINIGLDGPDGYNSLVFTGNQVGGINVRPNPEAYPEATLGLRINSSGVTDGNNFPAAWSGVTLPVPGDVPLTFSTTIQVEQLERLIPGERRPKEDEWIRYETSSGVHSRINDKARDIYTDKMFADLKRLIDFADSLQISDPRALEAYFGSPPYNYTDERLTEEVAKQLSDEKSLVNSILHDRFNNILDLVQRHTLNTVSEHTRMGARMAKFDMMLVRLEEDEVAYTELLSDTIDTDMIATFKRKESAETVFGFALRAIANTTQLSLADFINR